MIEIEIPNDPKDCFDIRNQVFVLEQGVDFNIEMDEFDQESTHFLLRYNSKPACVGRLRVIDQKVKFERIATLKKFRGLGLGKKLMVAMEEFAQNSFPQKEMYMHAQESAKSFYESIGWKVCGEEFKEANISHFPMNKTRGS